MRHISRYLGLVTEAERALGDALVLVALRHMNEPDIREGAQLLSSWSEGHIQTLRPAIAQFGKDRTGDSERLRAALFRGRRWSAFGLLRDLHDLALLAEHVHACWTVLVQCAKEFRDARLQHVCEQCAADTSRQRSWLDTKIRHTAPQAVLVAADPARELLSAVPTRAAVRRARGWKLGATQAASLGVKHAGEQGGCGPAASASDKSHSSGRRIDDHGSRGGDPACRT